MTNREALERRVYRLATLLTGNPVAATGVIRAVLDAQPDLAAIDSPHLDRLTVLRSREIPTAVLADESIPIAAAECLAGLPAQAREAWVFQHVYEMGFRSASKAMDCSTAAGRRHLERAEAEIGTIGAMSSIASSLRAYSMRLEIPAFHRAREHRRRRARQLMLGCLIAVSIVVIIFVSRWLIDLSQPAP